MDVKSFQVIVKTEKKTHMYLLKHCLRGSKKNNALYKDKQAYALKNDIVVVHHVDTTLPILPYDDSTLFTEAQDSGF